VTIAASRRIVRRFLTPAPIHAFTEGVLRERAMLALTDPEGELEAVAPLSQSRAWAILLDLDHRPPETTVTFAGTAGQRRDERQLLERLGADLTRTRRSVRCPAHEDRGPSLSWRLEGDKALIHCFAGCTFREILDAVAA
jgi:hypothetical protein